MQVHRWDGSLSSWHSGELVVVYIFFSKVKFLIVYAVFHVLATSIYTYKYNKVYIYIEFYNTFSRLQCRRYSTIAIDSRSIFKA